MEKNFGNLTRYHEDFQQQIRVYYQMIRFKSNKLVQSSKFILFFFAMITKTNN